jgi:hypothetical protein
MTIYLITRTNHPHLTPLLPSSSLPTYSTLIPTLFPSLLLIFISLKTLLWREIDPDSGLAGC